MREQSKAALADALKLLLRKDRFTEEVRAHLSAEGHDPEVVDEVVQFLTGRKLLNDKNATQRVIERNSGKRSVGIERLREELEKLGAPLETVEANLAALAESEPERALEALRAKYKSGAERGKAGRFLHSRGFGEDTIEAALDAFCGRIAFHE